MELDTQSTTVSDPASTNNNTSEVDQPDDNLFLVVREDLNIDTMPYPYPRYNKGADVEAHVRTFLTTWQANHVSQRLVVADAKTSKITEFDLSLDGQAVNRYSQHDLGEFSSCRDLQERFIRLFHRQIPKRDLLS